MFKKILILTLLLSNSAFGDVTLGYLYGAHIGSNQLNNSHPFLEIDNVIVYRNSFDKTSIAAFYKENISIFNLRVGITSGYDKYMDYKHAKYENPNILGVSPFIVPSIEYNTGSVTYVAALMFNSINIGLGVHF